MIEKLGIGTDITDINKFKKITYSSNKKFYEKIFLPSEIKYCLRYKNPSPHFAGKFAVKESVIKSIPEKISFLDIETFHTNSKPQIRLKGLINKKYSFQVSISHDKNFAIAVIISEKT